MHLIRGRVFCAAALLVAVGWTIAPRAEAQELQHAQATFVGHFAAGVPADARGAVNAAMAIWARRLVSAVPIEVDVDWGGGLPRGVAAETEPITYAQAAPGDPFEPAALANALAGRDLEPTSSDIHLVLGTGIRWYTGVDGACPGNATDMETMVLHELAHGLGFADSFRPAGAGLAWGRDGMPVGLDTGLFDPSTGALDLPSRSAADLLSIATSRRIVWRGAARDSHGHAPVMYAPRSFEPGSSLAHFDDDAYPAGDPDALMTSLLRRGEVIRRIGPGALGVLHDLGWQVVAEPPAPVPVPVRAAPPRVDAASAAVVTPAVAAANAAASRPAVLARLAAAGHDLGSADTRDAAAVFEIVALAFAMRRVGRWLLR